MEHSIISELAVLGKFGLSLLLGFLIGVEREITHKPAGMRTYMLVAGSATLFVTLVVEMVKYFDLALPGQNLNMDPVRVIEAIVVGVSFIGAGTILKVESEHKVENLTTAAGLLVTAGVGIAVALEQYLLAMGASVMVLLINHLFIYLRIWVGKKSTKL